MCDANWDTRHSENSIYFCMRRPIDMSSFRKVSNISFGLDVCKKDMFYNNYVDYDYVDIVQPWAAHASDNAYQISVCSTISFGFLLLRRTSALSLSSVIYHSIAGRQSTLLEYALLSHVRHVLMTCIRKDIVWPCITLKTLSMYYI